MISELEWGLGTQETSPGSVTILPCYLGQVTWHSFPQPHPLLFLDHHIFIIPHKSLYCACIRFLKLQIPVKNKADQPGLFYGFLEEVVTQVRDLESPPLETEGFLLCPSWAHRLKPVQGWSSWQSHLPWWGTCLATAQGWKGKVT